MQRILAWPGEQGESEIARAVVAHDNPADVPELTPLDKALLARDEPTGLVMACCLVHPGGIRSLIPIQCEEVLAFRRRETDTMRGSAPPREWGTGSPIASPTSPVGFRTAHRGRR